MTSAARVLDTCFRNLLCPRCSRPCRPMVPPCRAHYVFNTHSSYQEMNLKEPRAHLKVFIIRFYYSFYFVLRNPASAPLFVLEDPDAPDILTSSMLTSNFQLHLNPCVHQHGTLIRHQEALSLYWGIRSRRSYAHFLTFLLPCLSPRPAHPLIRAVQESYVSA